MSKLKINLILLGVVGIILTSYFYNLSISDVHAAQTDASSAFLNGYTWSDNIGWIYFSSVPVQIGGYISGYAWSDNIGWIKFGGLSGFPTGAGTASQNAQIVSNTIYGWARACAGTADGNCFSMKSRDDGWDGWIALNGNNYSVSLSGQNFSGYAWGSDVIGWINFNGVYVSACYFNGQTINEGSTVTAYQSALSQPGYNCVDEQRRCTKSVLTGNYTFASCATQCAYTYENPPGVCSQTTGLQSLQVATQLPIGCTGTPEPSQHCTVPVTANFLNVSSFTPQIHFPITFSWTSTGVDPNNCRITETPEGQGPTEISTATSYSGMSKVIDSNTNFIINCSNGSGGFDSNSISIVPKIPIQKLDAFPGEITWQVENALSCTLTDNTSGIVVARSGSSTAMYAPDTLDAGIPFTLDCEIPGQPLFTRDITSVIPMPKSICTITQSGNGTDPNIYVNRSATWSVVPYTTTGTTFSSSSREWGGTNISGSPTGTTFDKIYTTIGPKTIYATTSGMTGPLPDQIPFVSICTATTTVRLGTGTSGEI